MVAAKPEIRRNPYTSVSPNEGMVRETFHLTVEVLNCTSEETAIATAASYVAYCDTTNTIGYAPKYQSATVVSDADGPIRVNLSVEVQIGIDNHLKQLMDELANMSKILSVERGGVVMP